MTPERWKKIKALFSSAQDCPVEERDNFLTRECAGDLELKMEVERLLDSARQDSFLEDSAVAGVASMFAGEEGDDAAVAERLRGGDTLNDRYEIVRLLGRGGMGEVYLANDKRMNRRVALKVLHPDLVSSKESLRRFALEAQAASALNHPHIMTVYEFDTCEDDSLVIVAEYIVGKTLNRLIGRDLPVERTLDIAIQVASALAAAHEAGIAHRDVKPENIMVRDDGYAKILDFGLAKLSPEATRPSTSGPEEQTKALHKTKPGAVMGTAAYMSPEQARGIAADGRSDIWGLGVVLYEMLTGQRPFGGETHADIIVSVLTTEPPRVSSVIPDLPRELDNIASKALAKNIDERYQTFAEMRADLEVARKRIDVDESFARTLSPDQNSGKVDSDVQRNGGATRITNAGSAGKTDGRMASYKSFASIMHEPRRRNFVLAAAGLLLASILFIAGYFVLTRPVSGGPVDSIAVLPFENRSGDAELDPVADGLSESLLDRLAALPDLKVISRSSSFKLRGSGLSPGAIAAQLGARALVTGSVSREGDELVVRYDIADAVENRHIAGGSLRRSVGRLADLQGEIARNAVDQLRFRLTGTQRTRLAAIDTENSEAYRYYLNGLVELNGPNDTRGSALDHFEKAVELDPAFAEAYAQIAWVYWSRANASGDPGKLMPKARQAAERALELDAGLARAHTVMAMVHEYDLNWEAADAEYRKAIELSPNLDFARNNYAFFLSVMDRQDEALQQLEEQHSRDPLNRRMWLVQKAVVQVQARRFDDALQTYADAQAVEPQNEVPNIALGYAYAGKGLFPEAAAYYQKAVDDLGGPSTYSQSLVYLAATYAKIPEKQREARSILKNIEGINKYSSPAILAAVYSALGDRDAAMALLEKAYIRRDVLLRYIGVGYEYDDLRDDPRFQDLLTRTGLRGWKQ